MASIDGNFSDLFFAKDIGGHAWLRVTEQGKTLINGGVSITGGSTVAITTTATGYAILPTDRFVDVTSTASARTLTLPNPAVVGSGYQVTVLDGSGAAGTHNITVDPFASETINGGSSAVISSNYGHLNFICNGTNWFEY